MNKISLLLFAFLGTVSIASAQEPALPGGHVGQSGSMAARFESTSAAQATLLPADAALPSAISFAAPESASLSSTGFADSSVAAEAWPLPAAPRPKVPTAGRDFPSWEIGLSFAYVRFRSAQLDANLWGEQTTVAYYLDPWLALEGSVTSEPWGTKVFGETSKYVNFSGGAKLVLGQRRLRPWAHVLAGFAHVNPQLAGLGKNGFAVTAGGGGDYYVLPTIGVRVEGDYLYSRLYSDSQNNFQVSGGVFFRF